MSESTTVTFAIGILLFGLCYSAEISRPGNPAPRNIHGPRVHVANDKNAQDGELLTAESYPYANYNMRSNYGSYSPPPYYSPPYQSYGGSYGGYSQPSYGSYAPSYQPSYPSYQPAYYMPYYPPPSYGSSYGGGYGGGYGKSKYQYYYPAYYQPSYGYSNNYYPSYPSYQPSYPSYAPSYGYGSQSYGGRSYRPINHMAYGNYGY